MNVIQYLGSTLHVPARTVEKFVSTAPHRYKIYYIPKRNGGGRRRIAQPSKELKSIQRLVLREFLQGLPVHDVATAYQSNSSIRRNAEFHKDNQYLLKMDFSDFFPSLRPPDLIQHVEKHLNKEIEGQDRWCLERLFFYSNRQQQRTELSIGAPSSPFISNTLMYDFDCLISTECENRDITYTRYADDITLSTNVRQCLFEFPDVVVDFLANLEYPNVSINGAKTVFLSKKVNRHVTGLVLTNDGEISIGRSKKRFIRSLVHTFGLGKLDNEQTNYLRGYLSFVADVEPEFIDALIQKYGSDVISAIRNSSPN